MTQTASFPQIKAELRMSLSRPRMKGRFSRLSQPSIINVICSFTLLLTLSQVCEVSTRKLSDTQAMYTGLVRKMGGVQGEGEEGGANYVLSFGPDNAEIFLKLCIEQGHSGQGLARDPTPGDSERMSVTCLREYEEQKASSNSAPSSGMSAYDPISQVWYHSSGEDGFSSAYLTGVSVIKHGSIGQGKVTYEGFDAAFTLSSLEYNRAEDSLFGIVTYSTGTHYVVSIKGTDSEPLWDPSRTNFVRAPGSDEGFYSSSNDIVKKWDRTLRFRHIYRLREVTGVVPAISAMEPITQMYMCIGIEGDDPYFYIINSGMDQGGIPKDCPTLTTQDEVACPECKGCVHSKFAMPGVATSIEVYKPTEEGMGYVYMLVYNNSGHYFMQYDLDLEILHVEDAIFLEDADTRVVYGLSAFAPNGFGMMYEKDPAWGIPGAASIQAKKMTTFSYMTRSRDLVVNKTEIFDLKQGKLRSLSWGAAKGKEIKRPEEPIEQQNQLSLGPGLTFTSFEAQSTTIPVAEYVYPLYAHVDGGGIINVKGGPFVDAPSLSCKWTIIDDFCTVLAPADYAAQCQIYSEQTIYVNATYMICMTPPVGQAMTAKLTVSLSGVVWSFDTNDVFVFFTTGSSSGRAPLFGSSKGMNAIIIKGVNVNKLSWDRNNLLADSRCEFGDYQDPKTYMTDHKLIFNSATCENITIGPVTEVYCAFSCTSPQIPHEYCLYEGTHRMCPLDWNFTADKCDHLCTQFVPECPRDRTSLEFLQGKCRPLIEFNFNVPLRLVFAAWKRDGAYLPEGQRVDYGQFYYTSGGPPVVLGAQFTKDVSGLIIEFDVSTNRGQLAAITDETIYQSADELLQDAETFGEGAFAAWPDRKKVIISFGKGATITEQTYPKWRPYVISDYFDKYAFIGEGSTFTIDPISPEDKPPTTTVLSATSFASFCSAWVLSAADSQGGGGRSLNFGWFVTVRPTDAKEYEACDSSTSTECFDTQGHWVSPWVSKLQATLSTLNQPIIYAVSFERKDLSSGSCNDDGDPNSCSQNGLHVCFDKECDIRPGFRYSWKVVTYSWLWTGGTQKSSDGTKTFTCGQTPVPRDLWMQPQKYITCPAMSLATSDPTCTESSDASECSPWATLDTVVSDKPLQDVNIYGPSTIELATPNIELLLQGFLDTKALLECDTSNSPQSSNKILLSFPQLMGFGTPADLATTIEFEWRIMRKPVSYAGTQDVCTESKVLQSQSKYCLPNENKDDCLVNLGGIPSRRTVSLKLPANKLESGRTYFASLSSRVVTSDDDVCTFVQITVSIETLNVDLFLGVYLDSNQPKENALGGQKRGSNMGVEIGDLAAAEATQELRVYASILNPGTPNQVQYLYDWNCRYWQKDLYQYWQASRFKDAPVDIVKPCTCVSGDINDVSCLKTWGSQNSLLTTSLESMISIHEKKFSPLFNHTLEFTVTIAESDADGLTTGRTAQATMYATVYYQLDSRYVNFMSHRQISLELEVDKSKLPSPATTNNFVPYTPLSIKGFITNQAGERIQPSMIPMGSETFTCPGGLPSEVNGIDRICWFEWAELIGTDLADASLSRYSKFQKLSDSASFALRMGLIQAESSFVVRLSMVKSVDESSPQITYSWIETSVTVNGLPRNGYVQVQPSCGMGLLTEFTIAAKDWNDDPEDLPLAYAFTYQRIGSDQNSFMLTEFSYNSQHVVRLPYSEAGSNCKGIITGQEATSPLIAGSKFCKVLEVSAHVRNINSASIISSTTVDIWRPQFGTDLSFNYGGKVDDDNPVPSPAFQACNGVIPIANLQNPKVYVDSLLDKAMAYAFANNNFVSMDMTLRNAAAFFNNEIEQVNSIFGLKEPGAGVGFKFRVGVLKDIYMTMLSMSMLPTTSAGIESFLSAAVEIFGHEASKQDLCLLGTDDLDKIIQLVNAILSQIKDAKLNVRTVVIQSLVKIAEVTTHCLFFGEPFQAETLRTVEHVKDGHRTTKKQIVQSSTSRRQGDFGVRALSEEVKQFRSNMAYDFNVFAAEQACPLLLDASDEKSENQILMQGDLHTFMYRRAYPWTPSAGFALKAPEFLNAEGERQCGPIKVEVGLDLGNTKVDVCVMVFHYNPKDSTDAMSGSFTSDGASQHQYGVPWPLSKPSPGKPGAMCPVRVSMHRVPRDPDPEKSRVFLDFSVTFDLTHEPTLVRNWFVPQAPDAYSAKESHNPPKFNTMAYNDVWFSGICQQWGETETAGSWFEVKNSDQIVQYNGDSEINQEALLRTSALQADACKQMHLPDNANNEPIPEKIADGMIKCRFGPGDRTFAASAGVTLFELYGVVSERADCLGSLSAPAMLSSPHDFDTGQLEYARLLPLETSRAARHAYSRRVCDKCSRCGGFNVCELGCDSKLPTTRPMGLDLCGTCGGQCFGANTEIGKDPATGDPIFGTCVASQCLDLILTFSALDPRTTTKYFFGQGLCPPSSAQVCTNIIRGNCEGCAYRKPNDCPGCVQEVRSEVYVLDSDQLVAYEDVPYTVPQNNLTLESFSFPERRVVMHLCAINEACRRYKWESGKSLGKTPSCQDLHFLLPQCAIQCNTPDDYFDNAVYCAAGDFEFDAASNAAGICVPEVVDEVEAITGPGLTGTFVPSDPGAPPRVSRTMWKCSGTPVEITQTLDDLKFTPPKLYTSGRPSKSYIYWRFTFDSHDPEVYRKDIKVTVLPVNSPPLVSGSTLFRVQEDRPTILSPDTPGRPGLLAVSILDDAGWQSPHEISVSLTIDPKFGSGRLSIGGSRDPPLCPGCPLGSGGAVMIDADTCECRNGPNWSHDVSPWYEAGESLIVHAPIRLMNSTVLMNLEYLSGDNLWGKYLIDNVDIINVLVADNGYAQWNQSARRDFDFSENLTHSQRLLVTVEPENDPPLPIMPTSLIIHQGGRSRLLGGHIVDFDADDFAEDPFSVNYDMSIEVETGVLTLDLKGPNCSVLFNPLRTLPKPIIALNTDARDVNVAIESEMGLFLDGSQYCKVPESTTDAWEEWKLPKTPEQCSDDALGIFEEDIIGPKCWKKQKCNKMVFMKFDTNKFQSSEKLYPGATITLRMWLQGCVPNNCLENDCMVSSSGDYCKENGDISGQVTVNSVSCNWGRAGATSGLELSQNAIRSLEVEQAPVKLGSVFVKAVKEMWIEVPLDMAKVREADRGSEYSPAGQLCVNVVADPSLNKSLLLFGAKQDYTSQNYNLLSMRCRQTSCGNFERAGYQALPHPQLVLVQGRSYNCTGSECSTDCSGDKGYNIYSDECVGTVWTCNDQIMPAGYDPTQCSAGAKVHDQKQFHWRPAHGQCLLRTMSGNTLRDTHVRFAGTIDPLNVLLGNLVFSSFSDFNNAMGTNLQNITVKVTDTTAMFTALKQGGWFDPAEATRYTGAAWTKLVVIPRKIKPIELSMMPIYNEPWLKKRLEQGELSAYVMLEDCGGRPVQDCEDCESACPTVIATELESIPGESLSMKFTVEFSCKLGTITVPKSMRSKFVFDKGTGFRDRTMRFTGFIPDVRDALTKIQYHTKQDQSLQYKNQYTGACSRPCFLADIGPSAFENKKETGGCEQACGTKLYQRINNFNATVYDEEDSQVYLDAVVITFDDRASTGIGLTTYNKILMYNIYTIAINDRPCTVFAAEVTDGCREKCASKLLTSGCQLEYDDFLDVFASPGAPFDIVAPVMRVYREDDVEPVKLGGMVVKPLDMYDSVRRECRVFLAQDLAKRGTDTYVEPDWMSDCPLLAVRISAIRGEVSLNNRENLNFISGGASRFANTIEFIGHPIDCNVAMRQVLYKMSSAEKNYNSARGIEKVTFTVNDQGFSGADPSGEFEGSSQASTTVVDINILPVNDQPEVIVPRPTDFIEFKEHQEPLLQSLAFPPGGGLPGPGGLSVMDVDSNECGACSSRPGTLPVTEMQSCLASVDPETGLESEWEPGRVTLQVSVKFGRLHLETQASPGIAPLPDWAKRQIEPYLHYTCQEEECRVIKTKGDCELKDGCDWSGKVCACSKTSPSLRCSTLKFRAPSDAIEAAISALRYTPAMYYNSLTYVGQVETLRVSATDKRRPDADTDTDFFCGETEKGTEGIDPFVTREITIVPTPINDPPKVGFFPNIRNPSFEVPAICQGPKTCEFYNDFCVGVHLREAEGWEMKGESGLTYSGWTGDVTSAHGTQHVFLHSHDGEPGKYPPSPRAWIEQTLTGFTLGLEYTVSLALSARTEKQMGCMINISMIEDPEKKATWLYNNSESDAWNLGLIKEFGREGVIGTDTWIECRGWCELSASVEQVNPGPAIAPFNPSPKLSFVAHSPEYRIKILANRIAGQVGDRMVFVDDLVVQATRVFVVEDVPFRLDNLQIVDPDITEGSLAWVRSRPVNKFVFELSIASAKGTFNLIDDPTGCMIMPASDNLQLDYDLSMIMNDEERILFGIRCNVGEWANQTFRTPCPAGWVGSGIPPDPCINLPLEKLTIDKTLVTSKEPGFPLAAATILPSKTVVVQGEVDKIKATFSSFITYTPDRDFNTENRGIETLTMVVNDLANVEIAPAGMEPSEKKSTNAMSVFVKAINDPATIDMSIQEFTILEDGVLPLRGIKIDDVDVNEAACKGGLCPPVKGLLYMKLLALNGSFSFDPAFSQQAFESLVLSDYGREVRKLSPIYSEKQIYHCLWRVWCDDLSSPRGSMQIGVDFAAPCAHVPRYHSLEECVEYKLPFCQIVRSILGEADLNSCKSDLIEAALNEKKNNMLDEQEIETLKGFQKKVILGATASPIVVSSNTTSSSWVLVAGTLPKLQQALEEVWIAYQPNPNFNGKETVTLELNDFGNEGIQYPCQTPPDLPQRLHLEHCMKSRPYVVHITEDSLTVNVVAVNDKPQLVMHDAFGNELEALRTVDAIQNISTFLPPMKVKDVDLLETPKAMLEVSLQVKGGSLSYNYSKVTGLESVFLSPGGGRLFAKGFIDDINILLANVEYRSFPLMLGADQVLVDVNDLQQTGQPKEGESLAPASFFVGITVTKPAVCRHDDCRSCVDVLVEDCGWCPESCGGRGKCRAALPDRSAPLFGLCNPYTTARGTKGWNMCDFPPDNSWMKGAVGAPLLFIFLVASNIMYMWTRKMHGSIPIYTRRVLTMAIDNARKLRVLGFRVYLLPPAEASNVQIMYMVVFICLLVFLPSVLQILFATPSLNLGMGEATYFNLDTDGCDIFIKSKPQNSRGQEQPSIQARITSNTSGLSAVFVEESTCGDTQYLKVHNERVSSAKYQGYSCAIDLFIPQPIRASVVPAITINNVGQKVTSIRQQRGLDLDLGGSSLSIKGTILTVDIINAKMRLFNADFQSGYVRLLNTTFDLVRITTESAPILVTCSAEESMDIRTTIDVQNADNNVCLVSSVSTVSSEEFAANNRCDRNCANVTETVRLSKKELAEGGFSPTQVVMRNVTSVQCEWECSKFSEYTLMPYRKNADPTIRSRSVELKSDTGEIHYSTIPLNRVPPMSGRSPLDRLLLVDGLEGSRSLRIPPAAAAVLDSDFHPAGANRPREDFFIFNLQGPSRPAGFFVWTSDQRYLVLARELLAVLSFGLLVPTSMESMVTLSPSECPYFDFAAEYTFEPLPPGSFTFSGRLHPFAEEQLKTKYPSAPPPTGGADRRGAQGQEQGSRQGGERRQSRDANEQNSNYVQRIYTQLYKTIDGNRMPTGSTLAYKPSPEEPFVVFEIDVETEAVSIVPVTLSSSPGIRAVFLLSIVCPAIVAIGLIVKVVLFYRTAVREHRRSMILDEMARRKLLEVVREIVAIKDKQDTDGTAAQSDDDRTDQALLSMAGEHDIAEIDKTTSFFYFVELQFVDPAAMKSIQTTLFVTFMQTFVNVAIVGPLFMFSQIYNAAYLQYVCPYAKDVISCQASRPLLPLASSTLSQAFLAIAILELFLHYSATSMNMFRKTIRYLFYLSMIITLTISLVYISIVVIWICLGLLVSPARFSSITCSLGGLVAICCRYWSKASMIYLRVRISLASQANKIVATHSETFHSEALLKRLVSQHIETNLRLIGFSKQSIVRKTLGIAVVVLVVVGFLFFAFNAFTDTRSTVPGYQHAIVCASLKHKKDTKILRDKIFDMVAKTRRHVEIDLRFILSQIKLGIQLIERSNKANREYEDEFGKPDSEDEDDEAFQARLERQEGAKRAKALQVYKVRQDIARKLVLADRMQTFDTARIWTTVPYEMNAFSEDGNPLDDQDQWEWASTSTRVSTQYSTTVASSSRRSKSQVSKSRLGLHQVAPGVQSAPESIGESASRADSYSGAPAGAQVNIPATQDVNFFDPEQHLLVLVLDHSEYENAQAQAAGVQQGEDDSKVLADFWGTGFVDREMDVEIVAKLAEALDCDPSRFGIQWSRLSGGEVEDVSSGDRAQDPVTDPAEAVLDTAQVEIQGAQDLVIDSQSLTSMRYGPVSMSENLGAGGDEDAGSEGAGTSIHEGPELSAASAGSRPGTGRVLGLIQRFESNHSVDRG